MTKKTYLTSRTVTTIEVAVVAKDGEKVLGSVMLATTVTKVKKGTAWIPAVNGSDGHVNLPSKVLLETWVPLDEEVAVLEISGEPDH
ncbi:hypothetical protein PHMEG_00027955 [Phytophthora megakarya]|uniref:Uncharacterized protein n=1 Tax=Phytophthora megakarya TaxID=4795 RepID=A0A225V652_9STRA|nr:hypothetical protein PHMEG_00027955 [Phytophthora megakarya]